MSGPGPQVGKSPRNVPRKDRGAGRVGRPPKGYTYDPKSIPGLRDAARAKAAGAMDECVALWMKIVRAGLKALENVDAAENVTPDSPLFSKLHRSETWTDENGREHTERREIDPYAGLTWADVNRAAENIADRAGLARKSELDIDATEIPVKLFRLTTYRTKDGVRRELPPDTAGDSEQS